jgi:hypothetical protein
MVRAYRIYVDFVIFIKMPDRERRIKAELGSVDGPVVVR